MFTRSITACAAVALALLLTPANSEAASSVRTRIKPLPPNPCTTACLSRVKPLPPSPCRGTRCAR